ncbi:hypothetical protein ACF9IK_28055 [Kitasatospora hibisci]|uniref:hypothetical protein n=1 Tax=Kitasatospora hibisci TaxID=3369522 RepID=UPI003754ED55
MTAVRRGRDGAEGCRVAAGLDSVQPIAFAATSVPAGTLVGPGGDASAASARYPAAGAAAATPPGSGAVVLAARRSG